MKKKKKMIVVLSGMLLLGICCLFLLFRYRKEINETESLSSYRLSYTESTQDTALLLKQVVKDKFSKSMSQASENSHLFLHFAMDEQAVSELGYSISAVPENSYLIARSGNGLYLLGHNKEALTAAVYYLTSHLTDENGRLLLGQDERYQSPAKDLMMVYDAYNKPLSDYGLLCKKGVDSAYGMLLNCYISGSIGYSLPVSGKETAGSVVELALDSSLEIPYSILFAPNRIQILGKDSASLEKGIYQFANTYLGWMFAGTERERISTRSTSISIPDTERQEPWMQEREPIITLWNTNYSRGIFLNDSTSLKTDIMSFSEEQLYEYVKMMKYMGFTGIQATDMCSAWAGSSMEYVHERLRFLADAAHSLDMKFTLWVWGAEFTGYGWVDNTVTYYDGEYATARENPAALATFEKYYSYYASLADCCDRVIAHYYDPGNLQDAEDIAFFARMLRDKFHTVNPKIDFGVSCWVDKYDKSKFIAALGSDITLYENGHHDNPEEYESFRSFCTNAGCRVGTWAWNTCEMEIDQLAQMNFNPHIIKSTYETASAYDANSKPRYWSEMDSNHVVNLFSLYCAAQLLINPERDVEELTLQVATDVVGTTYGEKLAYILRLIEEARSGHEWSTYLWSGEQYIVKSPDYPAEEIRERCDIAIQYIIEMQEAKVTSYRIPIPIDMTDLLGLIRPQLEQIRSYACFRMEYSDLLTLKDSGASGEALLQKVNAIKTPVSEYNTVTGLWGQIEARAQQELLSDFCLENNLSFEPDPTFKQTQKNRIYSYFTAYQKGKDKPFPLYSPYFQYGLAYGENTTIGLVEELITEGLLVKDSDGGVYIADWEHYRFH